MKKFFSAAFIFTLIFTALAPSFAEENERPVERYNLKGGYRLIFIPGQEEEEPYVVHSTRIYLKHGNEMQQIAEESYGNMNFKRYCYRYEGFDFDEYFIITDYDGAYCHSLFEKSSGKLVLRWKNSGSPIADLKNNLLIFNAEDREETYLLDLKNMKQYPLNPYLDAERERVILWGTNWWTSAFEFVSADSEKITLRFFGFYKPVFNERGEPVFNESGEPESEGYVFTFDVKL